MLYFWQMERDPLRETVAVLVDNVTRLFAEQARQRTALHERSTDRATVEVLKRMVEDLNEDLPNLARQAAREAVTEFHHRRHADALSNWRTWAALVGSGAALGALIVGLVLR
jgi:hypothetical protein